MTHNEEVPDENEDDLWGPGALSVDFAKQPLSGGSWRVDAGKREARPRGRWTKEDWVSFQARVFDTMKEIARKKNDDYTAGSSDPFANFRQSEDVGVPPILGVFVRMGDKFQRIKSYLNRGELSVDGEGVEDALNDVIGYATIMLALLEEEKERR